jgi:hypothetical protein
MSFWSSEKLKHGLSKSKIVMCSDGSPAPESMVVNGAFELSLGPEAFITSNADNKKQILKEFPPNGFKLVEQFDKLPWQHLMFFGRDEKKENE